MKLQYRQRGLGLAEMLMVIGIIFTFILVAMGYYNKTKEADRVTQSIQNLGAVVTGIRDTFNSQGNYAGLQNSVVVTMNSFPDAMVSTGTNIKHPWKSDGVTIAPATVASANDAFTVQFTAIPEKSCNALVSATYRSYDQIRVNGTTITGVANTSTSCASGGSSNTIIWTTH